MFHFGILFVFGGHVMGLGVPESWTERLGISKGLHYATAVGSGSVAGFCTLLGMAILINRRRTVGPAFSATTKMDKAMYRVHATVLVLGLTNTVIANLVGDCDCRQGVSVWFRGIFLLHPYRALMSEAPIGFQLHGLAAFLLFALWPFTRLVHVCSAPVGYLTRPYIVYRSRDPQFGSRKPRREWERVG